MRKNNRKVKIVIAQHRSIDSDQRHYRIWFQGRGMLDDGRNTRHG